MTKIELKNHPVWQDLTEVLENIDANALVTEHLELCNYKICGYWDEQDKFSEEIILPLSLSKKYRQIRSDVQPIIEQLQGGNFIGEWLTPR